MASEKEEQGISREERESAPDLGREAGITRGRLCHVKVLLSTHDPSFFPSLCGHRKRIDYQGLICTASVQEHRSCMQRI